MSWRAAVIAMLALTFCGSALAGHRMGYTQVGDEEIPVEFALEAMREAYVPGVSERIIVSIELTDAEGKTKRETAPAVMLWLGPGPEQSCVRFAPWTVWLDGEGAIATLDRIESSALIGREAMAIADRLALPQLALAQGQPVRVPLRTSGTAVRWSKAAFISTVQGREIVLGGVADGMGVIVHAGAKTGRLRSMVLEKPGRVKITLRCAPLEGAGPAPAEPTGWPRRHVSGAELLRAPAGRLVVAGKSTMEELGLEPKPGVVLLVRERSGDPGADPWRRDLAAWAQRRGVRAVVVTGEETGWCCADEDAVLLRVSADGLIEAVACVPSGGDEKWDELLATVRGAG